MTAVLPRRLLAEYLGTALLVAAAVGSSVMAAALSPGNGGSQSLENAAFTDTFAGIAPGSLPGFIVAQVIGAAVGALAVAVLFPRQAAAPLTPTAVDPVEGPTRRQSPLQPG